MRKIKDVFRLNLDAKLSRQQIAGLSKGRRHEVRGPGSRCQPRLAGRAKQDEFRALSEAGLNIWRNERRATGLHRNKILSPKVY